MIDPEIVENDLERGKAFYTDIVHKEIFKDQIGIKKDKCNVDSKCLLFIIRALDFKIEQDEFDDITEKLWRCLLRIIGTYVPPILSRFYYGLKDNNDLLTLSEIINADYIEGLTGAEPIIPFPNDMGPNYAWMAEFLEEPLKIKWQDTIVGFNNGDIGSPVDLFNAPYTVNIFKVYFTNYQTEFAYPIKFLK